MKHLNTTKDSDLKDYAHYFRGFSFREKKLYEEAQNEFLKINANCNFYNLVILRLGQVNLELYQFKKAITYYEKLINLPDNQYKYIKKSIVYENLGLCHHHLGEFEAAEPYLIAYVKLVEQKKDSIGLIKAYGNIANLYYEQYKDDLAISYFEKAYNISKKINDLESKEFGAFNMAVVEENRNNYKKALQYRKESEKWKDSLNDQNKIWEVAQLEKQFAIKEKQKEVILLQAENKAKAIERNGLLYSVLTLLILLGVSLYFYKEKIKTNKIIIAQKENLDNLNATKDKLFSIVSHDLRSSVNALKTSNTKLLENLESKNLNALSILLQNNSAIVNGAYNLLDNLLHWALLQTKQSYFEITSLRLFFIIEQVAYNYKPIMIENNITFENNVLKNDVVFADQESLKIILRNLLDNAIKFSNSNGKIKIYTQNTNAEFYKLIIEDTGIGMNETTRLELLKEAIFLSKKNDSNIIGTGLGLQLCKSMIAKNKGKLSIESTLNQGTKMIIYLPKTM
ncbi:histidine kinase [Pseudalgibacter alginicilyticus]|uniref:histidine kinase n=2 Tax=Pseudalgibacter alginicilyticus TaxID=1736674 RepID=A0A0P0D9G5_9FLAO|nr:histidine kinase [Pseudalgibacter alginicilyticus]